MERHEAEEFVQHLASFEWLRHPLNLAIARMDSAQVVANQRGDCGVVIRYEQAPFWSARPVALIAWSLPRWPNGTQPSIREWAARVAGDQVVEPLGVVWEHLRPDERGIWWWGDVDRQ